MKDTKNTDLYLAYLYEQWKAGIITESEYKNQVSVIVDFRLWQSK